MISGGSCDTEDWSNEAVNSALPSQVLSGPLSSKMIDNSRQFGLAAWSCSGQGLPPHACSLAWGRAAITPPPPPQGEQNRTNKCIADLLKFSHRMYTFYNQSDSNENQKLDPDWQRRVISCWAMRKLLIILTTLNMDAQIHIIFL